MAYIKVVERGQAHKYKDNGTYQDLIQYCCNPLKAVAVGVVNLQSAETAAAEMEYTAQKFKKAFGKRISHIIISFSRQEVKSVSAAEQIARACAQYYAGSYQILYCVHMTSNLHIHMIVNRVSFIDGKKYPDRYEDRSNFWFYVHRVLDRCGIRLWK